MQLLERDDNDITPDACYDRGAPHFFSEVPQFGSSRPLPETDLGKTYNCYRTKTPMAEVPTKIKQKKMVLFPTISG